MRISEILNEVGGVGKIVKGVNTTPDVKPGETQRQAAKFGNKVDSIGQPPIANPNGITKVKEAPKKLVVKKNFTKTV